MKQILALVLCLCGSGVLADSCPAAQPDDPRRAVLMDQVRKATTEMEARQYSNQLWAIWATAPDAHAQDLLNSGMSRRRMADLDGALAAFDALIAYCPTYAEGYNQRAFVLFLRSDFDNALRDLDEALARSPEHIAAIAGKALTLMGLGQDAEAQTVLRHALRLNPWLSERQFLIEPKVNDI